MSSHLSYFDFRIVNIGQASETSQQLSPLLCTQALYILEKIPIYIFLLLFLKVLHDQI